MISPVKLMKQVPDYNKLKIVIKEIPIKGVGLFATKNIRKGETIAYYMIKVFRDKGYRSKTNFVYSFEVYRKNGSAYKRLIGDIDKTCFPDPGEDNIPYWGAFVNEPSVGQRVNSEIDIDLKKNFQNRKYLQAGETVVYKLVATRRIKKGAEILWYYGENYNRNYKVGSIN